MKNEEKAHSDEQVEELLRTGKANYLMQKKLAEKIDGKFNIELTPVEKGTLYNVPKERWFFTIVEKDTKMMYVQDAGCSMDNSEYCKLSQEEISYIQKLARPMLAE